MSVYSTEKSSKIEKNSKVSHNEVVMSLKRMPALQENVCNPYAPHHQFLQSLSSKSFGKRKEFGIRLTRALCYLLNLTEDHHIGHPPPPISFGGGGGGGVGGG